jgi:glucuronate isomerase
VGYVPPLNRPKGTGLEHRSNVNAALHPDRLFPADTSTRSVARELFGEVRDLPIVSMHGHIEASLLARNVPFKDPGAVLVTPDHYVTRLLHSRGVPLEALGLARSESDPTADPRSIWRLLCEHWDALLGTASHIWLSQELSDLFGIDEEPSPKNADALFELISEGFESPGLRPRGLYERFGIETLATTDGPNDDLSGHDQLREDTTFTGNVIPTFRPDEVLDPSRPGWRRSIEKLAGTTGQAIDRFGDLVAALSARRQHFISRGALATDHGHETVLSIDAGAEASERIFARLRSDKPEPDDARRFTAIMLNEMARMSCDDGLVMQLHPGVRRDHDAGTASDFGRDIGADFPLPTPLTEQLQPLLSEYGSRTGVTFVAYTVDEAAYGRELAPMASYYPALKIGAPWWFLDAPDAMSRCFSAAFESAGFTNFAGFVDDSRSLCSIGARHDMARRVICAELARLVLEHRLDLEGARRIAVDYCYEAPKRVFTRCTEVDR